MHLLVSMYTVQYPHTRIRSGSYHIFDTGRWTSTLGDETIYISFCCTSKIEWSFRDFELKVLASSKLSTPADLTIIASCNIVQHLTRMDSRRRLNGIGIASKWHVYHELYRHIQQTKVPPENAPIAKSNPTFKDARRRHSDRLLHMLA